MSNDQMNNPEIEENSAEISAETANIQATGKIVVSWEKDKQMNDVWRAFDQIAFIAFTVWRVTKSEAEVVVKDRAKQEYVSSKARWYAKAAGSITFTDNGKIE